MLYSIVAVLGIASIALLSDYALLLILLVSATQNFVLPWMFTHGWISETAALSLLVFKDAALLALTAVAAWRLYRIPWRQLPSPVLWIMAYAGFCGFRALLGSVALGEGLTGNLRFIRGLLFPFEALICAFSAGAFRPAMKRDYWRFAVLVVGLCTIASLWIYVKGGSDFWLRNADIAQFNVAVKGDPEWTVLPDQGISGTGEGRFMFTALAPYRLIGTFGDPLTAGFMLAAAAAIVFFLVRGRVSRLGILAITIPALALTFSRAAWVFAVAAAAYVAVRRRQYRALMLGFATVVVPFLVISPLRAFALVTYMSFAQPGVGDVYHAEAIRTLYSSAIFSPQYILGAGPLIDAGQTAQVENGFLFMLSQFGVGLVVLFVGLCVSTESFLRRNSLSTDTAALVAAAMAAATVLVSNFSFYPISFTAYIMIWTFIGIEVGALFRAQTCSDSGLRSAWVAQ